MKSYSNSAPPRPYRPIDYSKPSALITVIQAIVGAALVFAALFAWQNLLTLLTSNDNWRPWVLLALFAMLLIAIDALARAQWGWEGLRAGLIVGLFALAGFFLMRWGLRAMGNGSG